MNFSTIVTLGPSTLDGATLRAIDKLGPCIYRINGAHSYGRNVIEMTSFVREILPDAQLLLDLPGNKIRICNLDRPISITKGQAIEIRPNQLNFSDFYKYVKVGDTALVNDSIYTLTVESVEKGTIRFVSHSDGELTNNKGIHVQGIHKAIPFIFPKDLELMEAVSESEINYLGVSFVRTADDIQEIKKLMERMEINDTEIIAKIETISAFKNLGHIFCAVDSILIDRGDLSTDVGLFELSSYQERIIAAAKRAGKKIYLATQFLKNMEKFPIPLIAEIIDLHHTVKLGVNGIQLSEETAIGKYPVECVRNVFKVYYNSFSS